MSSASAEPPSKPTLEDTTCSCSVTKKSKKEKNNDTCCATTAAGAPCRYRATREGQLCGVHRRSEDLAITCPVCLDRVTPSRASRLPCGHAFHKRCIRRWLARQLTCPNCRQLCLEHLSVAGSSLCRQLRLLLRTLPMPPTFAYFPSYMISLLNAQVVAHALHLSADLRQLLCDIAFFSFSEAQFFDFLERFEL